MINLPDLTTNEYARLSLERSKIEATRERIPLRKWAIEQAIARGADCDLRAVAAEIEAWVLRDADV